jgi:hypothetical protein
MSRGHFPPNFAMVLFFLFGFGFAGEFARAQTTSWAPFPSSENIQNKFHLGQTPGCNCGIDAGSTDTHINKIYVEPTAIVTTSGRPISIRYDASAVCRGQTIRDLNGIPITNPKHGRMGTIEWQPGTIQDLPDTFGVATFSGYTQPTTNQIALTIQVQCYDIGALCTTANKYNVCPNGRAKSVTIPVRVAKAGAAKTELR